MALVGVSEAARLLNVNKSTISRQVKKGIIPNHGSDEKPLIYPDEARVARQQNVDASKSATSGIGIRDSLFEGTAPADQDYTEAAASGDAGQQGTLNYNTARTAQVAVQAKMAMVNYLRETGLLVQASDVEQAAQDHARNIRDRLLGLPQQIAGKLAGETDERQIIAMLTKAIKDCLSAAIKEMEADQTGEPGQ